MDAVEFAGSVVLVGDAELAGRASTSTPCKEPRKLRRAVEKILERILVDCLSDCLQSTLYLMRYWCA